MKKNILEESLRKAIRQVIKETLNEQRGPFLPDTFPDGTPYLVDKESSSSIVGGFPGKKMGPIDPDNEVRVKTRRPEKTPQLKKRSRKASVPGIELTKEISTLKDFLRNSAADITSYLKRAPGNKFALKSGYRDPAARPYIEELQAAYNSLAGKKGMARISEDGKYGPRTAQAIKNFKTAVFELLIRSRRLKKVSLNTREKYEDLYMGNAEYSLSDHKKIVDILQYLIGTLRLDNPRMYGPKMEQKKPSRGQSAIKESKFSNDKELQNLMESFKKFTRND